MEDLETVTKTAWYRKPIGEVLDVVTGNTPSKKESANDGDYMPFIKPPELQNGLIGEASEALSELGARSARVVPAGSVLISCIGNLGRVGLTDRPIAFNQQINAVKPHPELDAKYLFYYFQGPLFRQALERAATATTVALVNKGNFEKLPLVYPPLPEQRRIVQAIETQLGRLDAAVARLHAAKAQLKRYKQAVLKAAYTGQLFVEDVDMSDDAQLPEGWRWGTLGDFVKIRNGYAFKSSDYKDEGVLLIRQSNLDGNQVTTEGARYMPSHYLDEHPGFHVVKGDILIGMSGSIGKLCTYDLDIPALQNQRTGLLQFKDEKQKPWVWSYLPLLEQSLLKQGKGVAVLNVSAKQIEASLVPVAPIADQQRIIDEVEQRMSTIDETETTLDAQLEQSTRLRQAVLKRAFEGRLLG